MVASSKHLEALMILVLVAALYGVFFFSSDNSLVGQAVKTVEEVKDASATKNVIALSAVSLIALVLVVVYVLMRKGDVEEPR